MKNPYKYPLSFGSLNKPVEKNIWHKLQFIQIGNKLIGAIDGIIMVEFTDDGFSNNGPVLPRAGAYEGILINLH